MKYHKDYWKIIIKLSEKGISREKRKELLKKLERARKISYIRNEFENLI